MRVDFFQHKAALSRARESRLRALLLSLPMLTGQISRADLLRLHLSWPGRHVLGMSLLTCWNCAAVAALITRFTPRPRSYASFLAERSIAADVVFAAGPDHTTQEAAATLGLHDDSTIVKSLVFIVNDTTVIVLARGCDRISLPLLRLHFGDAAFARLATPTEAHLATGFAPGTIAPLGEKWPQSMRIVMDKHLRHSPSLVYAGTGEAGQHLRISADELWRATSTWASATVAQLVVEPSQHGSSTTPSPLACPSSIGVVVPSRPEPPPPQQQHRAAEKVNQQPQHDRQPIHGEQSQRDQKAVDDQEEDSPGHNPRLREQHASKRADSHGHAEQQPAIVQGQAAPRCLSMPPHEHDVRTKPKRVGEDIWALLRLNPICADEEVELEVMRVRRQG